MPKISKSSNKVLIISAIIILAIFSVILFLTFYQKSVNCYESFNPGPLEQYSPQSAIQSKVPTMVLFYDGLSGSNLSAKAKAKINKKNNDWFRNYDNASRQTKVPFYKLDISNNATKAIWNIRMLNYGPKIVFYSNPSAGDKSDGRDEVKGYKTKNILKFLNNKAKKMKLTP